MNDPILQITPDSTNIISIETNLEQNNNATLNVLSSSNVLEIKSDDLSPPANIQTNIENNQLFLESTTTNIEITSSLGLTEQDIDNRINQTVLVKDIISGSGINISSVSGIYTINSIVSGVSTNSWLNLISSWDSPPVLINTTINGSIYSYTFNNITRYRLVPDPYNSLNDTFFTTYVSGVLSTPISSRVE